VSYSIACHSSTERKMRNNEAFYGQVAFNGLESLAASDYANMGLMFPLVSVGNTYPEYI